MKPITGAPAHASIPRVDKNDKCEKEKKRKRTGTKSQSSARNPPGRSNSKGSKGNGKQKVAMEVGKLFTKGGRR